MQAIMNMSNELLSTKFQIEFLNLFFGGMSIKKFGLDFIISC